MKGLKVSLSFILPFPVNYSYKLISKCFVKKKYKKILAVVSLLPYLPPRSKAPKVFKRSMLFILRVSTSFNLPFTVNYSSLQADLSMLYGEKDKNILFHGHFTP